MWSLPDRASARTFCVSTMQNAHQVLRRLTSVNEIGVLPIIIYALASLLSTILSGIAGGGGGFIMTPLLIFLGLSPAQAVSTGKLAGLSVSVGSLHRYRTTKVKNKKFVVFVMALALAVGLFAPVFIKQLDAKIYQQILGILILVMIPVIKMKKLGVTSFMPSQKRKTTGWLLLFLALSLQAIFSGGLGVLVILVMVSMLGLDSITAQIAKRWSQVLLNSVIVLGVIASGLIVWEIAMVGIVTSFTGGKIGAKLALKKGNDFVMDVFMLLMLLSGIGLLIV